MNDVNFMQEEWDASYERGGNILFYPHEEIIRFVNKYVRKRTDYASFKDILQLPSNYTGGGIRSLDLGCGIGRHIKFLDEFGLDPYGIDLSETAILKGKEWLKSIGKQLLASNISVASVSNLPFPDNFFAISVSHGVLDSMPRDVARRGMKEVKRVLMPNGLMYLDLIMGNTEHEGDEIVSDGYEEGTVQSYFTREAIKEFLTDFEILEFKIITWADESDAVIGRRAHLIVKNSYKEF